MVDYIILSKAEKAGIICTYLFLSNGEKIEKILSSKQNLIFIKKIRVSVV